MDTVETCDSSDAGKDREPESLDASENKTGSKSDAEQKISAVDSNLNSASQGDSDSSEEIRTIHVAGYRSDHSLNLSLPKATLLGKLKAKQRLNAFLSLKPNIASSSPQKKFKDCDDNGVKVEPKVSSVKKAHKIFPDDIAKAVIEEIEMMKKVEIAMIESIEQDIFEKNNRRSRSRSRDRYRRYKEKNFRRFKGNRKSIDRRSRCLEKERYPKSWYEMKEKRLSIDDVKEIKSHMSRYQRKPNECYDFRKHSLFVKPSIPLNSLVMKSISGQEKTVPIEYIRFTRADPTVSYSINFEKNKNVHITEKEVYELVPRSQTDMLTKLKNSSLPAKFFKSPKKSPRKWFPKTALSNVVDNTECELLEPSMGLSILQNYTDEEDEDEKGNASNASPLQETENEMFSTTREIQEDEVFDTVNSTRRKDQKNSNCKQSPMRNTKDESTVTQLSTAEEPKKVNKKKKKTKRTKKQSKKKTPKENLEKKRKKKLKDRKKNDKPDDQEQKEDVKKASTETDSEKKKTRKRNSEKSDKKKPSSNRSKSKDDDRSKNEGTKKSEENVNTCSKNLNDERSKNEGTKKSEQNVNTCSKNLNDERSKNEGTKKPEQNVNTCSKNLKKNTAEIKSIAKNDEPKRKEIEDKKRDEINSRPKVEEISYSLKSKEKKVIEKTKEEPAKPERSVTQESELRTPDTEEYHSHWESDEDVSNAISYSPVPAEKPKKIANTSWESDEDIIKNPPIPKSRSKSRYVDVSPQRSLDHRISERSLEMPLNIKHVSRRNTRRFDDRVPVNAETRLLYSEDSWERGEYLKIRNDIETQKLKEERESLSEERRLLEKEKRKLAEKLEKAASSNLSYGSSFENSYVQEMKYDAIESSDDDFKLSEESNTSKSKKHKKHTNENRKDKSYGTEKLGNRDRRSTAEEKKFAEPEEKNKVKSKVEIVEKVIVDDQKKIVTKSPEEKAEVDLIQEIIRKEDDVIEKKVKETGRKRRKNRWETIDVAEQPTIEEVLLDESKPKPKQVEEISFELPEEKVVEETPSLDEKDLREVNEDNTDKDTREVICEPPVNNVVILESEYEEFMRAVTSDISNSESYKEEKIIVKVQDEIKSKKSSIDMFCEGEFKEKIEKKKKKKTRKYSSSSSSSSSYSSDTDSSSSSYSSSTSTSSSSSEDDNSYKETKIKKNSFDKIKHDAIADFDFDEVNHFPLEKDSVVMQQDENIILVKKEEEIAILSDVSTDFVVNESKKQIKLNLPLPVPSPTIVPPPVIQQTKTTDVKDEKQSENQVSSTNIDSTTSPIKRPVLIPTKFLSVTSRKQPTVNTDTTLTNNSDVSNTCLDNSSKFIDSFQQVRDENFYSSFSLSAKFDTSLNDISGGSHDFDQVSKKSQDFTFSKKSEPSLDFVDEFSRKSEPSQDFVDDFFKKSDQSRDFADDFFRNSEPSLDEFSTRKLATSRDEFFRQFADEQNYRCETSFNLDDVKKEEELFKGTKRERSCSPFVKRDLLSSPKRARNLSPNQYKNPSPKQSRNLSSPSNASPKRNRILSLRRNRDRSLSPKRSRRRFELSPPRRRNSPSPRNAVVAPVKRSLSPKRSISPYHARRNYSPRRNVSPPRNRNRNASPRYRSVSPKYRDSSPGRRRYLSRSPRRRDYSPRGSRRRRSPTLRNRSRYSYSRSPSLDRNKKEPIQITLQRLAGLDDYGNAINKSPINSPLDGFKRSLADSTISDDQLLQQNSDDFVDSPRNASLYFGNKPVDSPRSPKRIPLDERINFVLGIDKEAPKPIDTTYSNNFTYSQYSSQYENYLGYDYVASASNYGEAKASSTKVVQIGNVLEVVPTDNIESIPPPPPLPVEESAGQQKILQVGNMLQIVPTVMPPKITATIPPKLSPVITIAPLVVPAPDEIPKPVTVVEVLPPVAPVEKISPEVMMKLKIAERKAERERRHEEREKKRNEKEKRRKEKEKRRQTKIKQKTDNMIKQAILLETEALALGEDLDNQDNQDESATTDYWSGMPVIVSNPTIKPAGKGILLSHGFSKVSVDEDGSLERRKSVKFADGVVPGEGTSPSGGEELSSPPPVKIPLPKEKRYTKSIKTKKQKKVKVPKKKKIKVKIIRKTLDSQDDDEDNLPPPSPPPGSPPPHIFPPRIKTHTINNIHPSFMASLQSVPVSTFHQFRPNISVNMPPPIIGLPHGPPPPLHSHHGPPHLQPHGLQHLVPHHPPPPVPRH